MQKSNYILITTLAVSLMLSIPLAFGMATVTIGGNSITFEEDATGGIVLNENSGLVLVPDEIEGHPAYLFQHSAEDTNLIPTFGDVEFEVKVPPNTKFIIYAYVHKGGVHVETDIKIDININGNLFTIHVFTGTGILGWWEHNKGYYSANNVDGNNVMQKIEIGDISTDDFMLCEDGEAVLNIVGQRSGTGISKIEFAIIYA